MAFPPTPITLGAVATSTYINAFNADAATRFTNVETTANANATSIAAAANVANSGSLVKWGASGAGITPPAGTLLRNAIREFGAYASGPISNVVNYHGGDYVDRTATSPTTRFLADGTTSHATPTTGQERWDIVSLNLATAGVSSLAGTPAAIGSAGVPVPATATDQVLYLVYVRAGMTGIKDVSDGTNGFIITVALHNFGGTSGGGGGGGGTPLTNAVLGIGAGTPTNLVPILRGDAALGTVNSVNLDATDPNGSTLPLNKGWGGIRTDGANSGSLADTLRNFLPADLQSRIYTIGAAAHVSASPLSECNIVFNGRSRTNVADVAVTAAGAFGTRWLWADLSSAPGFTLVFTSTSSPTNAWQVLLGTYLWDTATLRTDVNSAPDFTPIFSAGSHQITPNLLFLPASGVTAGVDAMTNTPWLTATVLNGMSGTFTFSKACHLRPMLYLTYSGVGVPGTSGFVATFRVTVDGVAITFGDQFVMSTNALPQTLSVLLPTILVQAGAHTIAVAGLINSASASFSTLSGYKYLELQVEN